MTTRLPAIIPSTVVPVETPANIVRLFEQKAASEQPETRWAGKSDLKSPFVARRRLDCGTKSFGDPELYRLVAWENPSKPGEFSVGMMWETYPYQQQIKGLPKDIRLHLHSTHDSMEAAAAVCRALAVNNTFGTLREQIEKGGDQYAVLSRDPADIPFLRPEAWKGVFLFNAARLDAK